MGKDSPRDNAGKRVKSTLTLFTIIDALRDLRTAGVSQLAEELDMPKSTVHVHLKTLEEEGYLVNESGKYRFSFRFLELGGETRHQLDTYRVSRAEVDNLPLEIEEAAHFGVEERGQRVLLYSSARGDGVYDNSPDGYYTHLHWTAMGKALLAELSDDRIGNIVDEHGLPEATQQTITDREQLFEELAEVRNQGYATEFDEHREGLGTIAATLDSEKTEGGPASIGISGPTRRLQRKNADGELIDAVQSAVDVVNLELEYY
ncbi:IclR family transcriptional regulator [Saliphagus infecundisoli]|uniref:IclR family transcriptional regulator n=1 Tax=Saliphagus infecundisoli TaxID=1849069 RepID=A0ABD5QCG6_9EURY|nr:IclR family transcriptional regulator [Saliphagus infecundisoli]